MTLIYYDFHGLTFTQQENRVIVTLDISKIDFITYLETLNEFGFLETNFHYNF